MKNELGFDGGLTCAMQCSDLASTITWYSRRKRQRRNSVSTKSSQTRNPASTKSPSFSS